MQINTKHQEDNLDFGKVYHVLPITGSRCQVVTLIPNKQTGPVFIHFLSCYHRIESNMGKKIDLSLTNGIEYHITSTLLKKSGIDNYMKNLKTFDLSKI